MTTTTEFRPGRTLALCAFLSVNFAGGDVTRPQDALSAFKIVEQDGRIVVRYSEKRHTTRVLLENHPSSTHLSIPVSHLHLASACRGALLVSAERVKFVPESGDHRFDVRHGVFELKNGYQLRQTLEITPRGTHRFRFWMACSIRETVDTSGYVKTCATDQAPVMSLAQRALTDFAATRAAIMAAVERP